jgi:hypothetical protein
MIVVNFPGSEVTSTGSFSLSVENINLFTSAIKFWTTNGDNPRKTLVRCIKPREKQQLLIIFVSLGDYSQLLSNENV